MPIMFNSILRDADLSLADVRLLRHKDNRADKGKGIYELWRDARSNFDLYQSTQRIENRSWFKALYWASFVGTPTDETMFVGLFRVKGRTLLKKDRPTPHREGVDKAGTCDAYDLILEKNLSDLVGRLFIEWGPGTRRWVQRADKKNKAVVELRTAFKEDTFPGFLNFVEPLSRLTALPTSWKAALRSCKGIYLLTCPKTKEQYIGKASGEGGFWGRWECYVETGHGGNVGLKSRNPSDYQVSILEVAGTASTPEDIDKMEAHWKLKLQSQQMGLNRN